MSMTKFRLSNHQLMIEKGRHISMNKKDRICPICKDKDIIEDEIHFILLCPLYSQERDAFYTDIQLNRNMITTASHIEVFCILMNLNEQHHLEKLGEFIYSSFNKRKQLIHS